MSSGSGAVNSSASPVTGWRRAMRAEWSAGRGISSGSSCP